MMETKQTFQTLLTEPQSTPESGDKGPIIEAPPADGQLPESGDKAQSVVAFLAEGQSLLQSGDKAQALTRFQVATNVDPKSEAAWLGRANATENRNEAVDALDHVLHLNPENVEARKQRLALQVHNLREGVNGTAATYHENPLRRFVRPVLTVLAILIAIPFVVVGLYYAKSWLDQRAVAQSLQSAAPTLAAVVFPPTWTPQPTITPSPTRAPTKTPIGPPKPKFVMGQVNGTVNARSGPGTSFPVAGSLLKSTMLVLVGKSPDGNYYQVHLPDDNKLLWVSADFVDVTDGDAATLPEVIVPIPRPVVRPTATAVPPSPPPAPIVPQSYSFSRSKNWPNPHGLQCNRWDIHGTVWTDWRKEPQGAIAGMLVRVWNNGVVYATDISGSHGAGNLNSGYWEVNFQPNQAFNGLVAVVNPDGVLLSPQYPFALTADCSGSSSVTEMIIDFSH
jgi:hypothetical protein